MYSVGVEQMSMGGMEFREILLNQMKEYLDGNIAKEEYYEQAEAFYIKYADDYNNPSVS